VSLSTPPTTSINETSSALLASRKRASDFSFEVTLRTLEQLRQGNNPNNWEVGWIFFRYTDPANFYWVLLKTNGYELGKKQGSYDQSYDTYGNQIFLVNTDEPDFPINQNYRIKVLAKGGNINVFVNGQELLNYIDSNPLPSGSFCLYEEDSHVHFDDVLVTTY
ncbi:unnamed protein product, partial [marine sediment metagenome]